MREDHEKEIKKRSLKPAQVHVPFWCGCNSGYVIAFSLNQVKQSQLNKPVSKYSGIPGQIFGHQPQISCWLLELLLRTEAGAIQVPV